MADTTLSTLKAEVPECESLGDGSIGRLIHVVRGVQVMLDCDLAELYGVETKVFNQAVKRNEARFPPRFRFQLTAEEYELLRSQTVTSKARGGRRYLPYAFTEQGIAMLSAVLRSETAVEVSIKIIDEFVAMRRFLVESSLLLERVQNLELSQRSYQRESDEKFTRLFKLLEEQPEDGQRVFFAGQLFDALSLFVDLVQQASAEIVLVDAYVDVSTLNILAKKGPGVDVTVYTNGRGLSEEDVRLFNAQHPRLSVCHTRAFHDRFLILDREAVYHVGASLKDAGKKCFAVTRLQDEGVISSLLEAIDALSDGQIAEGRNPC